MSQYLKKKRTLHFWSRTLCWGFAAIVLGTFSFHFGDKLLAEEQAVAVFKQGADFQRQLDAKIGIQWKSNPLHSALERIAQTQQITIFLDRRVDPDQKVDFEVSDVTLREMLIRLAEQLDLGVSIYNPVVYLGPKSVTDKLATLAALRRQEARKLPAAQSRKALQTRTWQWEILAQPRELAQQLAEQMSLEIANPDLVAHDLWPQKSLAKMAAVDRLTLVLAGFDLTFEFNSTGLIQLKPMPENPSINMIYTWRGSKSNYEKIGQKFPNTSWQRKGNQILINGRFEDHLLIAQAFSGKKSKKKTTSLGEKRYSIKVDKQPLGVVLKYLEPQLKLKLDLGQLAEDQLEMRISFEVKNASLDQLLKAVLESTGLSYRLKGDVLEIKPSSK